MIFCCFYPRSCMMFWYRSSKQYWDITLLNINMPFARASQPDFDTRKCTCTIISFLYSSDIDECFRCFNNSGTRFFPFGSQTEDILSNLSDDGSTLILLSTEFIFHGTTYTSIFVSIKSNAFLSLLRLIFISFDQCTSNVCFIR